MLDAYLFFKAHALPAAAPELAPELRMELWRPTLRQPLRWELLALPFLAWSLFHFLGVFAGRDYFLLLIFQGTKLVHRTCVLPSHFKFPFMAARDLQAAGLWTHPSLRGRGLGWIAIQEVMRLVGAPDRTLWYMVREENTASIRLAEKAGFRLVARGRRRRRLGLQAVGYFQVEEVVQVPGAGAGP